MAAVYDDAARHVDSLPGDLPRKAAATHIGMFFAWATFRGLVSEVHAREHAEAFEKLTRRWYSGRDYVLQALSGRIGAEHLSEEGQSFAEGYYAPGTYLRDYGEALGEHLATHFHVRDDWTSYDRLAAVLDTRLESFRAGTAPAAPLPPPDPRDTDGRDSGAPEAAASAMEVSEPPLLAAAAGSDDGVIALPPPSSPESGDRPIASPPPLPPRAPQAPPPLPSAPRAKKRPDKKKPGGSGKYWVLGIVLLFLAVKACGQLFEASRERGLRQDGARHWAEEVIRRQQIQQERERLRQQLEARSNRDQIRKARWAPLSEEQETEAQASGLPATFENALGMRFVLIPSGSFVMGSPGSERGRGDDEELHNVEISEPFHLLTTEVSVSLWSRYDQTATLQPTERSPSGVRSRPITNVSFAQATAFCRWLGERDPERTYRLPTEAEWEYACRAGTQDRFWWGDDAGLAASFANVADAKARARGENGRRAEAESDFEWFPGSDGHVGVAVVGSYRANPWGLYDMLGNASEWCGDWYGPYDSSQFLDPSGPSFGTRRVLRGGSCQSSVSSTRCAAREAVLPTESGAVTGFRVVSKPRR